ncbi:MAG: questin oxidase family protein, partial [Bacteriovoracaceae bacterium]|nr:questin oxidase family protein [Bacteriovoracaceae bacterium]
MKVDKLIEKHNQNFSTYYSGELYTHTPMALLALRELGASDKRLLEFYDFDTKKLEPTKEATKVINDENWKDFFGEYELETSYIKYFKSVVEINGIDKTLEKYFDILIEGVGAAAFHPIIRLSYAVTENNKDEVAISLATWATSYVNLEVNSEISEEHGIIDNLKKFQELSFNNDKKVERGNIANRMSKVSEYGLYKELNSKVTY